MTYSDYDGDELTVIARSCKDYSTRTSARLGDRFHREISCNGCNSWNGRRCSRRVLDNMLSMPELE